MTRQQIFDAWAPSSSLWSPWVKPVLFASLPPWTAPVIVPPVIPIDVSWAPPADPPTALVLDLPAEEGAIASLSLVAHRYRPVPLYNAHPGPGYVFSSAENPNALAVIDVHPIAAALVAGAQQLLRAPLDPAAPPAFLLDARRRTADQPLSPGRFDNRSVSFPTDFPSGNFLLDKGIRRALLVQRNAQNPQPDLAHTLRRWKQAGLDIRAIDLDHPSPPEPCNLARPSRLNLWWHYLTAALGLRHHPLGGFGGHIPDPSSAG